MNFLQRAMISLRRQFFKTILLFSVICLLGILMSFGFSTRQGIINTDLALRQQLPAVATIHLDELLLEEERAQRGEWVEFDVVTPELIREIGELPYVRMFDYTAWGHHFFSDTLVRVFSETLFAQMEQQQHNLIDWVSLSARHDVTFEQFPLKGIHHQQVVDIESGLIELVAGRVFSEEEVENGTHVILVSQAFLEANGLTVGSVIEMDYRIYDEFSGAQPFEVLLAEQAFEFEIIGAFDHVMEEEAWQRGVDVQLHIELINRIYVPNRVVESVLPLYLETFSQTNPELIDHLRASDDIEEVIRYEQLLFLLDDPTDLVAFAHEASLRLPDFWTVSDLSNAYANMASSMATMEHMANWVVIGAIVASLAVLSLLILLFMKDRQIEIGIYLALGERKKRLMGQMLVELFLVATVAMTFSLFVGHLMASGLSTAMLRTELIRQAEVEQVGDARGETPENLGFRFEMSHDEMLSLYQTSLSVSMVLILYVTTFVVVVVSTIFPIVFLLKVNPKDILLKGAIG